MSYEEMIKFYAVCKEMTMEEYCNFLHLNIDKEEKDFYAMILNFFMQKRQQKIINKSGE